MKTRLFVKELAQIALEHDMTQAIEKHEGLGGFNGWTVPIVTHGRLAEFIMLKDVKTILRGIHTDWKKRKKGIYFTARVQFCVTADLLFTPMNRLPTYPKTASKTLTSHLKKCYSDPYRLLTEQ